MCVFVCIYSCICIHRCMCVCVYAKIRISIMCVYAPMDTRVYAPRMSLLKLNKVGVCDKDNVCCLS